MIKEIVSIVTDHDTQVHASVINLSHICIFIPNTHVGDKANEISVSPVKLLDSVYFELKNCDGILLSSHYRSVQSLVTIFGHTGKFFVKNLQE